MTVDNQFYFPKIVMELSTVEIFNCKFHGLTSENVHIGNNPWRDNNRPFKLTSNPSVVSNCINAKHSALIITQTKFENIQLELEHVMAIAAIQVANSQVEIHKSTLNNNLAQFATISALASNITIADSILSNNSVDKGSLINIQHNSRLKVHNSIFTQNNAIYASIGAAFETLVDINTSSFFSNSGQQGGSINVQHNSMLNVYDSTFSDNNATYGAGILAIMQSSVFVTHSVFTQNFAENGASIDIDNGTLEVYCSNFSNNKGYSGFGIYAVKQATVYVVDSLFYNNTGEEGASARGHYSAYVHVFRGFLVRRQMDDAG